MLAHRDAIEATEKLLGGHEARLNRVEGWANDLIKMLMDAIQEHVSCCDIPLEYTAENCPGVCHENKGLCAAYMAARKKG